MKIILVLILSIFLYPPLTTQDSTVAKNQVICNIAGSVWTSTYVFDINQLPERCDIITIGQYAFDRDGGVTESDKGAIKTLIAANKPVYACIGFIYPSPDWSSIFDPPDADVFHRTIFDPLINFLNTVKVNGLLINCRTLYDNGVHAKKFYVGIALQHLDTEDYDSKCCCGPFPVSNLLLDGWTGSPFKDCPKLDRN